MTRFNAKEIAKKIQNLDIESATDYILDLAARGIISDPDKDPSPLTPSGAIPPYLKPGKKKKRHKKPGRKKGHPGKSRKIPDHIDKKAEHRLEICSHCQTR